MQTAIRRFFDGSPYENLYELTFVSCPKEARDLIEGDYVPDYVLTDERMPGDLGSDFVSELRERDFQGRIVLASGTLDNALVDKVRPQGVVCVNKPFGKARFRGNRIPVFPNAVIYHFETGTPIDEIDPREDRDLY